VTGDDEISSRRVSGLFDRKARAGVGRSRASQIEQIELDGFRTQRQYEPAASQRALT
jgi:hypothetical protein